MFRDDMYQLYNLKYCELDKVMLQMWYDRNGLWERNLQKQIFFIGHSLYTSGNKLTSINANKHKCIIW